MGYTYYKNIKVWVRYMKRNRIFFIGFMGVGKTTIGQLYASTIGIPWTDMDRLIEEKAGCRIPDIFAKQGEAYFRVLETQVLKELSQTEKIIVSCGGGVVLNPENVRYMKERGYVVYLKAGVKTLVQRLKVEENRPILQKGRGSLEEKVATILGKRESIYEAVADLVIDTEQKNPMDIVEELKKQFLQNP